MGRLAIAMSFAVVGCSFQPGKLPAGAGGGDGGTDAPVDVNPMADTDGDGVLDGTDNCISVVNGDQRNFDTDQLGDACDPCPHLPAMNTDADGDGVGDACDPQPAVGAETRALWTSFYDASEIAGWNLYGQFAVSGGKLVHTAGTEQHPSIAPPTTFQKTYAAVGVHLTTNSSGTSGIGLCTDTTGGNLYYCCELREGGTTQAIAISNWSGGGTNAPATWTGTFAAGERYMLEVNILGGVNKCTIRQGATVITTNGTSGGPHAGLVFIYFDYIVAEAEYLFVVETM